MYVYIFRRKYRQFVEQRMYSVLEDILFLRQSPEEHMSMEVSSIDLFDYDPILAHSTLLYPTLMLQLFDEVSRQSIVVFL